MISMTCSGCGKGLRIKDELAGKKGKCPNCGHALQIPAAPPAVADFVSLDEAVDDSEPPFPPLHSAEAPANDADQFQFPVNPRRKSQRRQTGASKGLLVIGSAIVAILALLGMTLWLSGFFGETENGVPLVNTSELTFTEESDELLDFPGAQALLFSPDGSLLIACGETEDESPRPLMMAWNVAGWSKRGETSPDAVYSTLAFAPDGQTLYASSGSDERIVLIDPQSLEATGELVDDGVVITFAVARDGTLASVTADDWGIQFWESGRKGDACEGPGGLTTSLTFSRDGQLLATTGERTLMWDVNSLEIVQDLTDRLSSASSFGASFSRGDEALAVACNDSLTRIFRVSDGRPIDELEGDQPNVFAVRYSPDGRTLLTRSMAGFDNSDATSIFLSIAQGSNLHLWNVSSGESAYLGNEVSVMETHSFAFSPDGSMIAATGNEGIRIRVGKK